MYKSRIKRLEECVESLEKVSVQLVKILYSGKSIGENIKTRRQSLGMTQEESLSRDLLIETYGEAKMAYRLGAITHQEFMKINHMAVYFMNTHNRELSLA